jgi:hypothetical protein
LTIVHPFIRHHNNIPAFTLNAPKAWDKVANIKELPALR